MSVAASALAAQDGDAPETDRWHHVAPGSPFFSTETQQLRMAAVLQADGRFARIILGENGQGAYVTVNLPGDMPSSQLRSDLVYNNGGIMTRIILEDVLDTLVMPQSGTVTYSFSVAPEDIRAFRGASRWSLSADGTEPVEITLDGSAKAIQTALTFEMPKTRQELDYMPPDTAFLGMLPSTFP